MRKYRLLCLTLAALMIFSAATFGFMSFGYLHGVPNNDGEVFIGFDFGDVETGEFNVQAYLGDLWVTAPVDPGVFLGFRIFYEVDADWADIEAGGYLGSNPLSQWPAVGTGEAGLYLDATFHLLPTPCAEPEPCGKIAVDLITNFQLGIDAETGLWDFGGEIGVEFNI